MYLLTRGTNNRSDRLYLSGQRLINYCAIQASSFDTFLTTI